MRVIAHNPSRKEYSKYGNKHIFERYSIILDKDWAKVVYDGNNNEEDELR